MTAKFFLVLGIVLLALFIRHEIKVKQPLLDLKLFSRNVTFAFQT